MRALLRHDPRDAASELRNETVLALEMASV
jgi:hypothetical protein